MTSRGSYGEKEALLWLLSKVISIGFFDWTFQLDFSGGLFVGFF
ncbi:MAG: hypothetical protein ACJAYE_001344 [Candidatus Azotimanducaceae bacterium]